jgi:hypothetical protein
MTCFICNQDHSNQKINYPLGATVEVLEDFTGAIDATQANALEGYFPRVTIPAGSFGTRD